MQSNFNDIKETNELILSKIDSLLMINSKLVTENGRLVTIINDTNRKSGVTNPSTTPKLAPTGVTAALSSLFPPLKTPFKRARLEEDTNLIQQKEQTYQ